MAKNPDLLKLGLLFEMKARIDEQESSWLHFQHRFLQTYAAAYFLQKRIQNSLNVQVSFARNNVSKYKNPVCVVCTIDRPNLVSIKTSIKSKLNLTFTLLEPVVLVDFLHFSGISFICHKLYVSNLD